jgi:hypothetical protein
VAELATEVARAILIAGVYGERAVRTSRNSRSPYLTSQPDGTIMVCAAYARLRDLWRHSIARMVPGGNIVLNRRFLSQGRDSRCCGVVAHVLSELGPTQRQSIVNQGGLGCIIVPRSLSEGGSSAVQRPELY